VIKAFLGAIAMLLMAGGGAAGLAIRGRSGGVRLGAEGTNSTPAVFPLPQLGSAGFVCNRDREVQPVFDLGSAVATEAVTIRAGAITRRNFGFRMADTHRSRKLVEEEFSRARELALPFGHYRSASFTIRQGTEAREIVATVRAEFVDGTFARRGVPVRLGACYAKRWSVQMSVSPY